LVREGVDQIAGGAQAIGSSEMLDITAQTLEQEGPSIAASFISEYCQRASITLIGRAHCRTTGFPRKWT
jgi:hypothetical protein